MLLCHSSGPRLLVVVLALVVAPAAALKTVVLGSGDPWLSLCTAKDAQLRGMASTCVSRKQEEAERMLWGKGGFEGGGPSPVKVVDGAENIGEALSGAEAVVLNGAGFGGLTKEFASAALNNAPALSRCALCVEAGANADAVAAVRDLCAARDVPLNVLRVGALKGGGPGNLDDGSEDLGLSRHFYDSNADLLKFQSDSYCDQYLCGVSAKNGDAPANFFQKVSAGQSVGRADGLACRAVAAKALVASLLVDQAGLDLTLQVEPGMPAVVPQDVAAWTAFFATCAEAGEAKIVGPVD